MLDHKTYMEYEEKNLRGQFSPALTPQEKNGRHTVATFENGVKQSSEVMTDHTTEFWQDEVNSRVCTEVWTECNRLLHEQFGIPIVPFSPEFFLIVDLQRFLPNTGGYHISESGQIVLDFQEVQDKVRLARVVAHEMGHFFAARKIRKYADGKVEHRQIGLKFPVRLEQGKINKFSQYAFTLVDEAVVEVTMMDILNRVKDKVAVLKDQEINPSTYAEARKFLHLLQENLEAGYQNPAYRYTEPNNVPEVRKRWIGRATEKYPQFFADLNQQKIMAMFQLSAWGKPDDPETSIEPLTTLITIVYGPTGLKDLARDSSSVDAAHPRDAMTSFDLWNRVSEPLKKKALAGSTEKKALAIPGKEPKVVDLSHLKDVAVKDYTDGFGDHKGVESTLDSLLQLLENAKGDELVKQLLQLAPDKVQVSLSRLSKPYDIDTYNKVGIAYLEFSKQQPFFFSTVDQNNLEVRKASYMAFSDALGITDSPLSVDAVGTNGIKEIQRFEIPNLPDTQLIKIVITSPPAAVPFNIFTFEKVVSNQETE